MVEAVIPPLNPGARTTIRGLISHDGAGRRRDLFVCDLAVERKARFQEETGVRVAAEVTVILYEIGSLAP